MINGKNEPIMLPCSAPIGILLSNFLKMHQYFNTFVLTRGFLIALLGSLFIYLDTWDISYFWLNTLCAVAALYLLLKEEQNVWFWAGFFIGIFWFWWISLSFKHYGMTWAIPFSILIVGFIYGLLFLSIAFMANKIAAKLCIDSSIFPLVIKAFGLLGLSYVHPFGFDWFKPELMFTNSYLGIQKWQFAIIILSLAITIAKRHPAYLALLFFSYQPTGSTSYTIPPDIQITCTQIPVKDKWKENLHTDQFQIFLTLIDDAIHAKKSLIILPESVFPVFLNRSWDLFEALKERAQKINIVTGALYWDGEVPHNSAYIFTKNNVQIANKVLLVPFGEKNPLPDFLSDWVNEVFYDGAVDYQASSEISDYTIQKDTYRNAICFEATSEKLYEGEPKQMIVLSNNGWFVPSVEPSLQKILLQYYSKKYGTTIYHSVNMSDAYMIKEGTVTEI